MKFESGVVYTIDAAVLFVPTVPCSYKQAVSPGDKFIVAASPKWGKRKDFYYFRMVDAPRTHHFGLTKAHAEKVIPFESKDALQ